MAHFHWTKHNNGPTTATIYWLLFRKVFGPSFQGRPTQTLESPGNLECIYYYSFSIASRLVIFQYCGVGWRPCPCPHITGEPTLLRSKSLQVGLDRVTGLTFPFVSTALRGGMGARVPGV